MCHGSGENKKFTERGIQKLILCASTRGDTEIQAKLQGILDRDGDASIECHKGCYCTYTSKEKIERFKKAQKRKADDEGCRVSTRSRTHVADSGGLIINLTEYSVVNSVCPWIIDIRIDGIVFVDA